MSVIKDGEFFGEGCLAGQIRRMVTATAMVPCTVLVINKRDFVQVLHTRQAFADQFLRHILTRNIRIEGDLLDQMFNSVESGLPASCSRWPGLESPRRLIASFRG